MSGGYFEYQCFHLSQFADRLQKEIDRNYDKHNNSKGFNFRDDTIEGLQAVQQFIEMSGDLARETEWLYSGDIAQTTFNESISKILDKFINLANEKTTEFYDNPNKEKE